MILLWDVLHMVTPVMTQVIMCEIEHISESEMWLAQLYGVLGVT
jgi:hypothetical protein